MRFRQALYFLLDCILEADHILGSTFLIKVNLADVYIHIWLRLNGIPFASFIFPKETDIEPQLVVFCLSIPMGCV